MRIWNVLFLMGALALGQGADVVSAQDRRNFTVDGDWQDWKHLGMLDEYYDVIPDTNSTVDIGAYEYSEGMFGPSGDKRKLFTFIFKFLALPFQGSEPTTVDLFFDVSADTTFGDDLGYPGSAP